jgi:hypothetical protein
MFVNLLISALVAASTGLAAPMSSTQLSSVIFPTREMEQLLSAEKYSENIHYNLGNPVLTGDVGVYLVWYGDWSAGQKTIIEDFIDGVGNSSWYAINKSMCFYRAVS